MDWTVTDYAHANHNPIVEVNGSEGTAPVVIDAEVGKPVVLNATGTRDPDGQKLHYHWFHYAEAGGTGTNLSSVTITAAEEVRATVTPTAVCHEVWLPHLMPCSGPGVAHIILAVTDEGLPRLTSYRRIILNVRPAHAP